MQRDYLFVVEDVFDDDDGAVAAFVGLFVRSVLSLDVPQLGDSQSNAKLFATIRTLKDQRLAVIIFRFIKSYEVVTFGAAYSFHVAKDVKESVYLIHVTQQSSKSLVSRILFAIRYASFSVEKCPYTTFTLFLVTITCVS